MNCSVKPGCLIKGIEMAEASTHRVPPPPQSRAASLASCDFQPPAGDSQLWYLGVKEATKGGRGTMSLMRENRALYFHPEPQNKTGCLHFQRRAPLLIPGMLEGELFLTHQPQENNGCFILSENEGEGGAKAVALGSLG